MGKPVIGSLRGSLMARNADGVVLDVNGVGYRVAVTARCLVHLGPIGEQVVLHTHLRVREDALSLFGFVTAGERDCFETLLGAHGVGPALAMTLLGALTPDDLRRAVVTGDVGALVAVPGVGQKTATRLVMELKSRLGEAEPGSLGPPAPSSKSRGDVRVALANLGYSASEIHEVLRDLPPEGDVAEMTRTALQLLGARR